MNKIKNFLSKQKGLYKIAFTACILILSLVVVAINDNMANVGAPVTLGEKEIKTDDISSSSIAEVIDGLKEEKEAVQSTEVDAEISDEEEINDATFSRPIFGKVIKPFSIDTPIYSKTMDDWRIHEGIDIACVTGAEVYCAQNGTVTDLGYDINLGNYIEVKNGEYLLKYTSLESDLKFKVGDRVSKGQLIGIVSESCISEICDELHFHFEIRKNGEPIDPAKLIMFE